MSRETTGHVPCGQTRMSTTACAGKIAMLPAVARAVAKRMHRTKGKSAASVNAYRCQCCGAWHVGGTDRRFLRGPAK